MSEHIQRRVVWVVVAAIGAGIGLLAIMRIREAREFSQPHQVQTDGGTNCIVQLTEAVVGKAETKCVLILYLRLENPNPFGVTLDRKWFGLVAHDRDHYWPLASGTQSELIKLPPNGVLEREMLSFAIPNDAVGDSLALMGGRGFILLVKDKRPFGGQLREGQFWSFRSRHW